MPSPRRPCVRCGNVLTLPLPAPGMRRVAEAPAWRCAGCTDDLQANPDWDFWWSDPAGGSWRSMGSVIIAAPFVADSQPRAG